MRVSHRTLRLLASAPRNRLHAFKHRIYWLTKGSKLHRVYFDSYQTRSEPIAKIRDWLGANPRPALRVLELGCAGGNNLRLMRELVGVPVRYVGFDIQPAAIAFARSRFPDDLFVVGDDRALLEQVDSLGRFNVFLASSVLSYLPEPRCLDILSMAARTVELVLVCDVLVRIDSPTGRNDGLFLHPYARLCEDAGLRILDRVVPPGEREYGTFTARASR